MKTILHVVASFNAGGVATSVKDICNNIDYTLYDVHLLLLSNNKTEVLSQLATQVKVHIIPTQVYNSGFINSINCLFRVNNIVQILREVQPDIIHDHVYPFHNLPLLLAMKFYRKQFQHIHTIHTTGIHYKCLHLFHKVKLTIEKMSYKLMHTDIVCISPIIMDFVHNKMHIPNNRLHFIPNGVNTKKFNPDLFLSMNNSQYFDIAYVARLDAGKNHITLLKAIKPLIRRYPNIRLIFIGDGELKQELQDYAISNNIEEYVIFKGNIFNVPEVLAGCDIGVFPSEYEGFSLAIIEMMSMGLPIICSNIPAFTSVFNSDEVIFCNLFDNEEWGAYIEQLYCNRQMREMYKQKSKCVAQKYSLELLINKYNTLYNNLSL